MSSLSGLDDRGQAPRLSGYRTNIARYDLRFDVVISVPCHQPPDSAFLAGRGAGPCDAAGVSHRGAVLTGEEDQRHCLERSRDRSPGG